MKKNILILGATGGIARAFCLLALQKGYSLILAGRDQETLERMAKDLAIRSNASSVPWLLFDACKTETHAAFLAEALKLDPDFEGVFITCGIMPSQKECDASFEVCARMIQSNFTGLVSILNLLASHFKKRKSGFISTVSSVAGDRGRPGNVLYGATKAALSVYLEGLRTRLHPDGVLIQTVKPGPVDTRMTKGLDKLPFLATPEKVAKDIMSAIEKRKDVVYTPWIWFPIMSLLCQIPNFLWKRMKL